MPALVAAATVFYKPRTPTSVVWLMAQTISAK